MEVLPKKIKLDLPTYLLHSEDGEEIWAPRSALKLSPVIYQTIMDREITDKNCKNVAPIEVPFPKDLIELMLKWLIHHQDDQKKEEKSRYADFDQWDKDFFRVPTGVLFAMMNAAHHLQIEGMMDQGASAAAELIRGKSTEEIREIYGIRTDEEQMEIAIANGGEGPSGWKPLGEEEDGSE